MVELAKFKKNTTLGAIENHTIVNQHRNYLGASQIGHECARYLWYGFRWCFQDTITPRVARLFQRGHREEIFINETLQSIGIKTWGDQTEVEFAYGHAKGHCDGMCSGVIEAPKTVHLLEDKTMSEKYFKDVRKNGVQVSKPIYYVQCQLYMKFLKLTRTLFVVVNKNDDSMYIERLCYDEDFADKWEFVAENIVLSEHPPEKRFSKSWYACKWCSAKEVCHEGAKVCLNCRTCEYCDILPKGQWECSKLDIRLTTEQQRIGCKFYKTLECLVK